MLRSSVLKLLCVAIMVSSVTAVFSQPDASAELKTRLEQAATLKFKGNDEEARQIYESLLPQLRAQSPSPELAEVLSNLADISNTAGQYDRAVTLSHESMEICRKLADLRCEAKTRNDAGFAYLNAGDYAASASELELALNLSTRTGDAETSVLVLNNLGNVYYYLARYSEALRTYESAAQLVEKSSSEQWSAPWRKITRLNLATLYQRLGKDQRAIAIYHEELDSPHDLSPREIAHVLANLGILYRRLGDSTEALKSYHDAEAWYARQKDVDGQLGVLKNIGIVLGLDLGRLQDALKTFDQAHDLAEKTGNQREIMQAVLYRAETLYRMNRLHDATRDFETARVYAVQLGTVEEEWKAIFGLGNIALRDDETAVAEQKFRSAIDKIESLRSKLQLNRLKTDFLADKRDVYDALIKLLLDRNDLPGALQYMERSRARVFQDRFFSSKITPASISLASLQDRLAPDTALLEFWAGTDSVAVIWITHESAGIVQKHLSSTEMNALVQAISELPGNLQQDWKPQFSKTNFFLPAMPPLLQQKYMHLLIVSDGFLSLLPFELIVDSSGTPLIEHHDITYMPSAALLLRGVPEHPHRFRFPWQPELLAFGDPAVLGNEESSLLPSRTAADMDSGSLPGSGEEIRSIAGMSAGRARLYLGEADRKTDFLDPTRPRAPLLHVSTHAVADLDNPERSRLLFSPEGAGQPNNFIFLKELYDLDLRGVSLATLSACDTERGRLVPGEGVQAFSRALLAAGAQSAVTTLWRVPDQATADFMKHFYFFLLKKHKSKAEALRLTKLEFLNSGTELSHPRFWAAFVLNGDGAEPVPRFVSWQALLIPLFVLAAAAVLLFEFKRWRKREKTQRRTKAVNAHT